MKETKKTKCPHCNSLNVVDTGNRIGSAVDYRPNKNIPSPNNPIYKCKDCEKTFPLYE